MQRSNWPWWRNYVVALTAAVPAEVVLREFEELQERGKVGTKPNIVTTPEKNPPESNHKGGAHSAATSGSVMGTESGPPFLVPASKTTPLEPRTITCWHWS
eukprot:1258502-Amphidinium_carterae.1